MTYIPEAAVEKVARAIWIDRGNVPRLFDEICRPDSNLDKQQSAVIKDARAAIEAYLEWERTK